MIIFFAALVIVALVLVFRILLPEMKKSPEIKVVKIVPLQETFDVSQLDKPASKLEKLEMMLADKNKNISLLEKELKVLQAQTRSFDKVKMLIEEEIQRLKEQNRMFRSELGLPTIGTRQGSIS